VEVLVQVPGEANVAQISALLDLAFAPDTFAWLLDRDGRWESNKGADHLQEMLIEQQRHSRSVG
jgi:polyphosphate kinase